MDVVYNVFGYAEFKLLVLWLQLNMPKYTFPLISHK